MGKEEKLYDKWKKSGIKVNNTLKILMHIVVPTNIFKEISTTTNLKQ